MTNISSDISRKLSSDQAEVLADITLLTHGLNLPFFVIGATARDIVFGGIFDLPIIRATLDLDLGIKVGSWEDYGRLRQQMLLTSRYKDDNNNMQRMHHVSGTIVDLVPFGPLEDPTGTISWPPDRHFVMHTVGFEEALHSSLEVTVAHDPDINVKVCTPAALAAMKIVAWHENYPARKKDAEDLLFLLKEYIQAGNEMRLYSSDSDLFVDGDFDYDNAGARLLGRDVARFAPQEMVNTIKGILDNETADDSQFRLVSDMMTGGIRDDRSAEARLKLIIQLRKGLSDEVR